MILLIGDNHGRFSHVVDAFEFARALGKSVSDVIFLGDIESQRPFENEIAPILALGVEVHWIVGNHDTDVLIPGKELVHLHPLGNDETKGAGSKITSPIVGIDLASQLVVTHSGSIYRLVGPRGEGEPTLHQLLHLCSAQWQWGRGQIMGVLEVFY